VRIVPRTWDLDAEYYRWGGSIELPYETGSYRRWKRILAQLDVDFVVVIRSIWEDPERHWMTRRPREFRLVYEDADTEIWRILPGPGEARKRPAQKPERRLRRQRTKPDLS
jgi:hypothetical protein